MKKSDFGVIACLYFIGFAFLAMTLQLPEAAQSYPLFLISLLLGLVTLYLITRLVMYARTRTIEDDIKKRFSGFQPKQFFGVCVFGILYLVLMYWAGYYISSILFLVGCMLFLRVKPLYILLATVFLMVLVYCVFSMFLKVPLPAGMLFG